MKQTIFANWNYPITNINTDPQSTNTDTVNRNLKTIHHLSVQSHLDTRLPNSVLGQQPPTINKSEEGIPRRTRRILSQLRTGKSPMLLTYLHKINPTLHPSPLCPLCKINNHDTNHLFSCPSINTTLTPLDLWNDPVSTAELLSLWEDALAAAGGGAGPQLVDGAGRG